MTRRGVITVSMIVIGLLLMGFSYFGGAAPWCADDVTCSNPALDWSPAIFVLGVIVAFSAAIYYEVAKDKVAEGSSE